MKKLLFLFAPAALLIQACSNDFDVTAPWKEIPVVYGILYPKDTAHYIRVEKAFLDPETNALTIAQIADSLYYPKDAIDVYLKPANGGQQIKLERVDGNLEGYVRKGGIFATHPNWLYKTKAPLAEGVKYQFIMTRADGKPDVTAETTIPSQFRFSTPNPVDIPPRITFIPDAPTSVEWRTDVNGVFFAVHFRIRYREVFPDGKVVNDTLYWTPVTNVKRAGSPSGAGGLYRGIASIPAETFFSFLVKNNPTAGNDQIRYFDGIDITIEGGGGEIEKYLDAAAANAGLTGAEVVPSYSNISEGFGLFTAKTSLTLEKVQVQKPTIEAMNDQLATKALNFQFF